MFRTFFISLSFFFFLSPLFADCNFKTGKYINELSDPSYLKKIDIKIPKSSAYNKNVLKIYASKKNSISAKLKKKFYAKVIVHYSFGICEYRSKIRQHGHQKDHILLTTNGKVVRSLDVELKTGNIMGIVNFKLLLPNTRRGKNEILASLILKKSGFISPETFDVITEVNNVKFKMIFQEKSNKELLEKNFKRESAIFEGDQSLIWGFKNFNNFELEPLSLAKMVNNKWFLKGSVSQKISLSAFSQLQMSYLNYANNIEKHLYSLIDPNKNKNEIFPNFYFTLLAMNGFHALRPHNRKYYYNPFLMIFEPIYYDGMIKFSDLNQNPFRHNLDEILLAAFKKPLDKNFINKLILIVNSNDLKNEFFKRIDYDYMDKEIFFESATLFFLKNINKLDKIIQNNSYLFEDEKNFSKQLEIYQSFQQKKNISQEIISNIEFKDESYFVNFKSGNSKELNQKKISKLLSKNIIDKKRTVLLTKDNQIEDINNYKRIVKNFNGNIKASKGVKINIIKNNKTIEFIQAKNDDWIFIENADILNWNFKLIGISKNKESSNEINQNFNEYGLTGCLTFYNSNLTNVNIEIENGKCEDSLNIISSNGQINNIIIQNAYRDAIDIDFSNINILDTKIINAGNDCLDFSGGHYILDKVNAQKCGDKGVSIGEKSNINIKQLNVEFSKIGISSKDFSKTKLQTANIINTEICAEVKQKKQEFGGALLAISKLNCDAKFDVDQNSMLSRGSW
jgi:hypothetical protein